MCPSLLRLLLTLFLLVTGDQQISHHICTRGFWCDRVFLPDICTQSTGVKYLYRIYKGLDLDFHSSRHERYSSSSSCEICRIFTPSKKDDGDSWLSAPQLAQWIAKRCQTVGTNPWGPAVPTSWPKALTVLVRNTTSGNWTHSYHRTRSQPACVHYLLTVLLQIWRCNFYYHVSRMGRKTGAVNPWVLTALNVLPQ